MVPNIVLKKQVVVSQELSAWHCFGNFLQVLQEEGVCRRGLSSRVSWGIFAT